MSGWWAGSSCWWRRSPPSTDCGPASRGARSLTGWTGAIVAGGFVAYHAVPWHSPLTNPYFGEPVGVPAWISVALAVGAGIWAAYEGLLRPGGTEDEQAGAADLGAPALGVDR